jgi:hypothetical protein
MSSDPWGKYPTAGRAADDAFSLVLQITHQRPEDQRLPGLSNINVARGRQLFPARQSESAVHAGREAGSRSGPGWPTGPHFRCLPGQDSHWNRSGVWQASKLKPGTHQVRLVVHEEPYAGLAASMISLEGQIAFR